MALDEEDLTAMRQIIAEELRPIVERIDLLEEQLLELSEPSMEWVGKIQPEELEFRDHDDLFPDGGEGAWRGDP